MKTLDMNRDKRRLSYDRDTGWKLGRRFEIQIG